MSDQTKSVKGIALHLPQFHSIPENDEWWGEGFTEWTSVKKAKSRFRGHYQPHIPSNNNYYDLSDISVLEQQATLARKYGVYGFCFYHYWFNGKLLLETPLHQMLETGKPDFPFCLSWANENWTRRWDGAEHEVLMRQDYCNQDDLEHIRYLIPFFNDKRYIKIDNKPVFLVYRSELHPGIKETTKLWRDEAVKAGFKGLFLIRMENFARNIDPFDHGFDAGLEFAPDITMTGPKSHKKNPVKYALNKALHAVGIKKDAIFENRIFDYSTLMHNMINRDVPDYTYLRSVCPSWDNSSRRKIDAVIYVGASPEKFGKWLEAVRDYSLEKLPADQRFIFINAWNEWGEGCHLEPDEKFHYSYLEQVKRVLS